MSQPPRRELGFTVNGIVLTLGILALVVYGVKAYSNHQRLQRLQKSVETRAALLRDQLEGMLKGDPAWHNSLLATENVNIGCLRDHKSCLGKGGLLAVRDANNRTIFNSAMKSNGFSLDGQNCANFSEIGDDTCPMRLDILWEPKCSQDCIDPQTVEIRATFRYRPRSPDNRLPALHESQFGFVISRRAVPAEPRTCFDLLQSGKTMDGTYTIKPDPLQAGFAVYCDQTHDGGGWALVANSARIETFATPLDNSLTLLSSGRLANAKISSYLNASTEFQMQNNIRLILPEVDHGIVLGMSTMGSTEAEAMYSAPTSGGDCKTVSQTATRAHKTPAPNFMVSFAGGGEARFVDKIESTGAEALGFQVCFGADPTGRKCGNGCGRAWTGSLTRVKGSLWIR